MKYPAIYKSVEGSEYLYQNKDSYYCYERQLWDSSEPHHDCHHSDTNITAEYLANTYGEVKSKEHAEFIKLLAESHGARCGDHIADDAFNYFYLTNGVLFFTIHKVPTLTDCKQITIPLPPECESVDEWPKVGDDVMFTDLLQHYDAYRDNYCLKTSKVIARFNTEQGEFITVHREYCAVMTVRVDMVLKDGALVKPKTPEQELRDLLLLLWEENNHDFDMLLDVVTEHVIKKPQ